MHRPPFDICHQLGNYGQLTSSLRVSIVLWPKEGWKGWMDG